MLSWFQTATLVTDHKEMLIECVIWILVTTFIEYLPSILVSSCWLLLVSSSLLLQVTSSLFPGIPLLVCRLLPSLQGQLLGLIFVRLLLESFGFVLL